MSTYWYYECVEHNPALRSDEEFTQHTDDYAFKRGVELAQNRPVPEDWTDRVSMVDDYFTRNACRFLIQHPECHLALVDEYGNHREMPAVARA